MELETGRHIPKNPDRFVFDEEVAPIFDNMARRSLPLYEHVYDMVREVCRDVAVYPGDQVWDFGVSTGRGLRAVRAGFDEPLVDYWGCDISQPMLDIASERCPWARFRRVDFEGDGLPVADMRNVRVALWAWTLQFLPDYELRVRLLSETYDRMAPGGVLFLMEKWQHAGVQPVATSPVPPALQRAYMHFRRDNGYMADEIVAKSTALKGAMWPWSRAEAVNALVLAGFEVENITGLYQMFNFGGLVAVK
ncbi:methyltransferase domain-containing protein [Paracoccus sp. MKU1]|uniref:methyltransferase domain-containing protein n=1 Tax=Paracoccus sp. MKU1 TaxID=1745182 RepID=UPI00137A33E9|nr:methyltransferase domain-containing protein [Paracoccus sp. MKU1]